jgi:hypothetical protein
VFSLLLGKCGANGVGNTHTHTHTQCPMSVRCVTLVFSPFFSKLFVKREKRPLKIDFLSEKKDNKVVVYEWDKKKRRKKTKHLCHQKCGEKDKVSRL